MLVEFELPKSFWLLIVETAAYIHNRIARSNGYGIPEGIDSGKEPHVGHIRVFGCLAYMFNPRPKGKLDSRTIPCIFVGYIPSTKQYKLYDGKRFYQTSKVRFDEGKKGIHNLREVRKTRDDPRT